MNWNGPVLISGFVIHITNRYKPGRLHPNPDQQQQTQI